MHRRNFAAKISAAIPAFWLGNVARADVIDLDKRSKAKREEEDHIEIKILGFRGESLGKSPYFKELTSWTCKYQITRIDGTITTRESPQVLSSRKGVPPTRFTFDLS
jgi:hypothetical protein